MQEPHEALEALVALETACEEAVEADNVFTGEGTLARRKIRDTLADLQELMEAAEASPPLGLSVARDKVLKIEGDAKITAEPIVPST